MLYLQEDFYNTIFEVKHKSPIASRSAPPLPQRKILCARLVPVLAKGDTRRQPSTAKNRPQRYWHSAQRLCLLKATQGSVRPVPYCCHDRGNAAWLTLYTRNVSYFIQGLSAYRAVNTLHFGYKNQSLNVLYGRSCCLFWYPYKTRTLNARNI
jgi:hypothetical protein